MTTAERELLIATAQALSALMATRENGTQFTDKVAGATSGLKIAILLMDKVAAIVPAALLTPRPKHVSIEHAPDPDGAAGRWKYARTQQDAWIDPKRDGLKHAELLALGEHPTHADVAAILGASWAYLSCDGCYNGELVRAVSIHDQYDSGHRYCPTCIREAAALLDTFA